MPNPKYLCRIPTLIRGLQSFYVLLICCGIAKDTIYYVIHVNVLACPGASWNAAPGRHSALQAVAALLLGSF